MIALSGCRRGQIPTLLQARRADEAARIAAAYRDQFGVENFYIELQHHFLPEDDWLNAELAALADQVGVGIVATNNVHYAESDGARLQHVLTTYPDRQPIHLAGMILIRQSPPTAKGYQFVTLEDEFGFINLIVRPEIGARYRKLLRETLVLEVKGRTEREGAVMNVLVDKLRAMQISGQQ
ncbi:MAG: hypothetical protein U0670_14150 [Anaerolineae bacterium]